MPTRARNGLSRCLHAAALLAAASYAASAADDTPAWLKELTSVSLPTYPNKVNAVVLYNEEHTTALDSGRLSTTTRTAVKILNRQGGDVIFFDSYDSASGKVRDFRAWMIAPSGKTKKYGKDEIIDAACAENDVYDQCRRRLVSGKRDAEAGAIFAYESTIEYQSFSNQLYFHFQDSMPVRLARFQVTVPQGWELKSRSFNGAPANPTPAGGTYTWQMGDLPQLELEPSSPSINTLAPWVGVNLLGPAFLHPILTWAEAAKLQVELNNGQAEPDEAMAAKARSLVDGSKSELDRIRAIGRFVQQVNYVSIQMNLAKGGGYKPHAAAQVFQKLYGDCKDKANLMRAMLKAVGITAYPVAIYSGDRTHVTEEWPSLGVFNHAISAIRVGPETQAPAVLEHPRLGRLLFFDPTDTLTPFGRIRGELQSNYGLLVAPDGGELVGLPQEPVTASGLARSARLQLDAAGNLQGAVHEAWSGDAAALQRAAMQAAARNSDRHRPVEAVAAGSLAMFSLQNVVAGNEHAIDRPFLWDYELRADHYARTTGPLMMVRPRVLGSESSGLLETRKPRQNAIEFEAPGRDTDVIEIDLPAGFEVDDLPPPVSVDEGFAAYQSRTEVKERVLRYTRSFEIRELSVPASKADRLKSLYRAIATDERAVAVLRRSGG